MTATESISSSCCLLAITSVPFSFTHPSTKVFAFGHLHYIGQSSELYVSVKWLPHHPAICPHVLSFAAHTDLLKLLSPAVCLRRVRIVSNQFPQCALQLINLPRVFSQF